MEYINGRLEITDHRVCDFIEKNKDNSLLIKIINDLFVDMIQVVQEIYKKTSIDKMNNDDLINKLLIEQTEFNKNMKNNFEKLSEGIINNVNSKILELIFSIDKNMNNIRDGINIELITNNITKEIKEWLFSNTLESNDILETKIKNHLNESIIENINKINNEIAKLPNEINNKIVDNNYIKSLDTITNNIEIIRNNIKELESNLTINTETTINKWLEAKTIDNININNVNDNIKQVPLLVKGHLTDIFIQLDSQSQIIKSVVNNLQSNINKIDCNMSTIDMINQNTNDIRNKVDIIDQQLINKKNSSIKGKDSELKLFDLLSERLKISDGYFVSHVGNEARSCDILVKRNNYQNIRIECKDYKASIGTDEVDKFYRDLRNTKDSGIFISLSSGICGRRTIEIEKLDINQVAILISKNNYDIDFIETMLHVIYKLNELNNITDVHDKIIIDDDRLNKIYFFINRVNENNSIAKSHFNKGLQALNEIKYDEIMNIIIGNYYVNKLPFSCDKCNSDFRTKTAQLSHSRVCKVIKKINDDDTNIIVDDNKVDTNIIVDDNQGDTNIIDTNVDIIDDTNIDSGIKKVKKTRKKPKCN